MTGALTYAECLQQGMTAGQAAALRNVTRNAVLRWAKGRGVFFRPEPEEVERDDRDLWMLCQRDAGWTHDQIAREHGMGREAVTTILLRIDADYAKSERRS